MKFLIYSAEGSFAVWEKSSDSFVFFGSLAECKRAYPGALPPTSTRPSLPELVPGYAAVGISKRACVRYVVDSRMRSAIARGKGNKAQRRAAGFNLVAIHQRR